MGKGGAMRGLLVFDVIFEASPMGQRIRKEQREAERLRIPRPWKGSAPIRLSDRRRAARLLPLLGDRAIRDGAKRALRIKARAAAAGRDLGRIRDAIGALVYWKSGVIPVHELYARPRATQRVLDDAAQDIDLWLARKQAERAAATLGA